MAPRKSPTKPPIVRCAIYTRKSTAVGLEQDFTSLDAQREACEAYTASQKHEGWQVLSTRYDDGGFTGANMERPALAQLLRDVDAGEVDCVVVYKVDRLSRSLLDFTWLLNHLEQSGVAFVSVTQHFNSQTSMGRLTLHILLSFAQFEREMISERTRDKMGAARRKGKYLGGQPPLGYDVDRDRKRLVVNETEANLVREIFHGYLREQSILAVVKRLNAQGHRNKQWTTKAGRQRGGRPFTVTHIQHMLNNPVYAGKVRYENVVYDGEHDAIIPEGTFDTVCDVLTRNRRARSSVRRASLGLIPRGLLRCRRCDSVMFHTYSQKGPHRYRYYVCSTAQKRGYAACATGSVSAPALEAALVQSLRSLATDTRGQAQALERTHRTIEKRCLQMREDMDTTHGALHRLTRDPGPDGADLTMAERERQTELEQRLSLLRLECAELEARKLDAGELRSALAIFEPTWEVLIPAERAKVLATLVERVDYDGKERLAITVSARGTRALGMAPVNTSVAVA